MRDYRVYLLNPHGSIVKAERLSCADDEAAVQEVMTLLRKAPNFHGFELWEATRCVHVHPARKPMHVG